MPQQCSSVASLFPARPGVSLLFVFLSSEGLDAKAFRTLVADGDFRGLAAHIANVVCMFGLGGWIAGGLFPYFASFLTSRPGPSKQLPCSARSIQHSSLRSWHQVRFVLKLEKQVSLRVVLTPFWRRPRNLGRQQFHCGCAGRTQRTRPGIA